MVVSLIAVLGFAVCITSLFFYFRAQKKRCETTGKSAFPKNPVEIALYMYDRDTAFSVALYNLIAGKYFVLAKSHKNMMHKRVPYSDQDPTGNLGQTVHQSAVNIAAKRKGHVNISGLQKLKGLNERFTRMTEQMQKSCNNSDLFLNEPSLERLRFAKFLTCILTGLISFYCLFFVSDSFMYVLLVGVIAAIGMVLIDYLFKIKRLTPYGEQQLEEFVKRQNATAKGNKLYYLAISGREGFRKLNLNNFLKKRA